MSEKKEVSESAFEFLLSELMFYSDDKDQVINYNIIIYH